MLQLQPSITVSVVLHGASSGEFKMESGNSPIALTLVPFLSGSSGSGSTPVNIDLGTFN